MKLRLELESTGGNTAGFVDLEFGEQVDTFGGSTGEKNARSFVTFGYAVHATKPKG